MNNDDSKKKDTQMPVPSNDNQMLATTDKNVFEVFADEINTQRIIGTLLKFTKGDWLIGRTGRNHARTGARLDPLGRQPPGRAGHGPSD
jgi:hypothetical protein